MAITTDDTDWEGMDSSGVMTATRYITIPAGNMKQLDLAESNLIPQIGDAHPENARWTVYSIGGIQHADIPHEYRISVKYRRVSGGSSSISWDGKTETRPWDLGIINHRTGWSSVQVPLTELWDAETNTTIPLVNGAGQVIPCMTDRPVRVDTFQINFNTQKGHKELAPPGTLNCNEVNFFGRNVMPYAGKIVQMTSEQHVVYQNDGKTIKWEYETITFEVHTFIDGKTTWLLEFLNVGNMAMWPRKNDQGEDYLELGRIYQYTPWKSKDMTVNAKVKPQFGCIDDVIMAREKYKEVTEDKTKEIPWSEAEDIPLTAVGTVDEDAITSKEYNKIKGYERQGVDWEQYIPSDMLYHYARYGK